MDVGAGEMEAESSETMVKVRAGPGGGWARAMAEDMEGHADVRSP